MGEKDEGELRWCVTRPPDPALAAWPRWMRSAAIGGDGAVYLPAAAAGNEAAVLLLAAWSAVPVVVDDDHLYVPAGWMAKAFPDTAELCALIEGRVRKHFNWRPEKEGER